MLFYHRTLTITKLKKWYDLLLYQVPSFHSRSSSDCSFSKPFHHINQLKSSSARDQNFCFAYIILLLSYVFYLDTGIVQVLKEEHMDDNYFFDVLSQ